MIMRAVSILLVMEMEEIHWELQTSNIVSLGGSLRLPEAGSLILLGCSSSSCYYHSTTQPINNSWIQHQGDKQVHYTLHSNIWPQIHGPEEFYLISLGWFMASSFSFLLIFSLVTWIWCELALSRKAISHCWTTSNRSGHTCQSFHTSTVYIHVLHPSVRQPAVIIWTSCYYAKISVVSEVPPSPAGPWCTSPGSSPSKIIEWLHWKGP